MQAGKAGIEFLTIDFSKSTGKPTDGERLPGRLSLKLDVEEELKPDDVLLLRQHVYKALVQTPPQVIQSRL